MTGAAPAGCRRSAESLAGARALARQWGTHGTMDVHTTDADGIPLPSYVVGETIAADEIEFIRSGKAPRDLVLALVMLLGQTRNEALMVGVCRALQQAIQKGST